MIIQILLWLFINLLLCFRLFFDHLGTILLMAVVGTIFNVLTIGMLFTVVIILLIIYNFQVYPYGARARLVYMVNTIHQDFWKHSSFPP